MDTAVIFSENCGIRNRCWNNNAMYSYLSPPHKVNLCKQAQTMGKFGAVKLIVLRVSGRDLTSLSLKLKGNPGRKLYKRTHNN